MKAFLMIMRRELLVRVRKRSFIIITLLGPILFGLLSIVPAYLSMDNAPQKKVIGITSDDATLIGELVMNEQFTFIPAQQADTTISYDASLVLSTGQTTSLKIYSVLSPQEIKSIQHCVALPLLKSELRQKGIADSTIITASSDAPWNILHQPVSAEKKNNAIAGGVGMISSVFIYLFIFMYGIQVLRAVMEEKQSRIVEILISSVKPFQLMAGKIGGIGLVCLIQFTVWVLLGFSITTWVQQRFQLDRFSDDQIDHTLQQMPNSADAMQMHQLVSAFETIPFGSIITCFLLYFLFSYLLYASLFAAIGSMIDHESDQQSLTFPVTAPLIITFVMASNIMQHPDSSLAWWFSMIPLTSPIAMMIRIPGGVPTAELILSLSILITTSISALYVSGKIYRTGILMYGKKASWAEAWKWVRS